MPLEQAVSPSSSERMQSITVTTLAKQAEELHPAHHRHVPVEQNNIGHLLFAARQRLLAIARFVDLELQGLQDMPGDLPDHLRIIDYQTAFH